MSSWSTDDDLGASGGRVIQSSPYPGVTELLLDHPSRGNALDVQLTRDLTSAIALAGNHGSRVIVLAGKGPTFCAGGDVRAMASAEPPGAYVAALVAALNELVIMIMEVQALVVSAVRGSVAGAGVGLVLASDVTLASERSKFVFAYLGVGLSPDAGVSYLLPRALGLSRARHFALLRGSIDAATACEWGLVNEVVADADFEDALEALVVRLAKGPIEAQLQTKRLLNAAATRSLPEQLEDEAATITRLGASDDAQQRLAAFTRLASNP